MDAGVVKNPVSPQKEPWPLWLHFVLLLAAQAAYALAYVNSPYLRTAILVPQLFRLAVWTVPVLLFLALEKRPVLDYLKLRRDALRGAAWGVVFGVLILAGNVVVHFAMSGSWQLDFRIGAQRWVGPVALVGLSEEVAFRGFFLQKFSERMGFARANLLQALLFLLMHLSGWILLGQFRFPSVFRLTGSVLLFALFSGWLLRRSRSLWACMIAHSFNNLASFVVPG
jgi:membrane protease YdiL (CAAX protease family)